MYKAKTGFDPYYSFNHKNTHFVVLDNSRFDALAHIVLDHALLAEGSQLEDPAAYVRRMNSLLLELDSKAGTG